VGLPPQSDNSICIVYSNLVTLSPGPRVRVNYVSISQVATQSTSLVPLLSEQIVTQVKDTCNECTFTVNHIRDSRLTCCGNRLDAVAYQARIISSHDVNSDMITSIIEQWIASSPALLGWNSVLILSSTWRVLIEDTLYVECSSPLVQELEQNNQTVYLMVLIALSALVVLILAVVILLVIYKCLRRTRKSAKR